MARIAGTGQRLTTRHEGRATVWHVFGQGPALLLLHGNYGSWSHRIRNIQTLARRYRLFVPDMPGFGLSDLPPMPYTAETIAEEIRSGLRELRAGPIAIVGFSFGATIAAAVATALGSDAQALVIVSTGAFGAPRPDPGPLAHWRTLVDESAVSAAHRANLAAVMIADLRRIDDLAVHLQAVNARTRRLKSETIQAEKPLARHLGLASCPVHGIFAAADSTIGPYMADRLALLRRLRPDVRTTIVERSGHWLPYERPGAFDLALQHHLAG